MFVRLFALPYFLFVCLMTLLPLASAEAVGLPGLLNGSAKPQPEAQAPLGQSLDDVIKSLENDQQRGKLLADLKNSAMPPSKPSQPPNKVCLV